MKDYTQYLGDNKKFNLKIVTEKVNVIYQVLVQNIILEFFLEINIF